MQTPAVTLAVLDALGVAFATFDRCADCVFASTAAMRLAGGSPDVRGPQRAPAWAQASRLVSRFEGPETETYPTPEGYALSLHRLAETAGATTLAVFHASAGESVEFISQTRSLTYRERQVAELVARGRTTKQVAASLGISVHTARHHTEKVFVKLSARSRVEVALMIGRGSAPPAGI